MATQVHKCRLALSPPGLSAQYTDESKRACKKHSLSSMGIRGAAEHVCVDAVASSLCEASCAAEHSYVDAVASSPWKPSSGAISKEIEARKMYDEARRSLRMTQQLRAQLHASKGKGKGKIKAERLRSWWDMSASEQWWLEQLWTGRLHKQLADSEQWWLEHLWTDPLHKQLAEAKPTQTSLAEADKITFQRFQ